MKKMKCFKDNSQRQQPTSDLAITRECHAFLSSLNPLSAKDEFSRRMSLMKKDVFSHRVEVAHFLLIVRDTEQQCHSFKDYTRGSVSGVLSGQISNLLAYFLASKSLTAKTPFCTPYVMEFIVM